LVAPLTALILTDIRRRSFMQDSSTMRSRTAIARTGVIGSGSAVFPGLPATGALTTIYVEPADQDYVVFLALSPAAQNHHQCQSLQRTMERYALFYPEPHPFSGLF
jgi:hypothetical protein